MKRILSVALVILFSLAEKTILALPVSDDKPKKIKAKSVKKIMEKVADWQLKTWSEKGSRHKWYDWTNAAGYTGLMALNNISNKKKYIEEPVFKIMAETLRSPETWSRFRQAQSTACGLMIESV